MPDEVLHQYESRGLDQEREKAQDVQVLGHYSVHCLVPPLAVDSGLSDDKLTLGITARHTKNDIPVTRLSQIPLLTWHSHRHTHHPCHCHTACQTSQRFHQYLKTDVAVLVDISYEGAGVKRGGKVKRHH